MEDESMPETLETIAAKLTDLGATTGAIGAKLTALSATTDTIAADLTALSATTDTIAADLTALKKTVDERFVKAEQQLAEVKSHLEIKIEAVDEKVIKLYDEVITQ